MKVAIRILITRSDPRIVRIKAAIVSSAAWSVSIASAAVVTTICRLETKHYISYIYTKRVIKRNSFLPLNLHYASSSLQLPQPTGRLRSAPASFAARKLLQLQQRFRLRNLRTTMSLQVSSKMNRRFYGKHPNKSDTLIDIGPPFDHKVFCPGFLS